MRGGLAQTLVVATLLVSSTAVAAVSRGPYVQQVTTDAAIVVVDLDVAAVVEIRYGDGLTARSELGTHHEMRLEGLTPDTRYDYTLHVDALEVSGGHAFWTAVEPGAPFRFVLYGDTRTQPDRHLEIVTAIQGEAANMLVHTGDLVADGEVSEQWDEFFSIAGPLLAETPLFPAVGNHDAYDGDALLFRQLFALPETELYYSFDYGNAHFIALDGHARIEPACRIDDQAVIGCLDPAQRAWLEADLRDARANPDTEHIFVLTHVGPYTSKAGRDGSLQMRTLIPLFERCGVTAILSGHDHYYQRGESDGGLPYVISGGAGAPLYQIDDPNPAPHTVHAERMDHHYVVVDMAGSTAELTAKLPDGTVIDSVTLSARAPTGGYEDCTSPQTPPDDEVAPSGGCQASPGSLASLAILALCWPLLRRRRRSHSVLGS